MSTHQTNEDEEEQLLRTQPDSRRRFRAKEGAGLYTVKVLIEALRARRKSLRGSEIALLGFPREDGPRNAQVIRDVLQKHGAHLKTVDVQSRNDSKEKDIDAALTGADAVVVATDSSAFRLVSRRLFKSHGIDIVIPTHVHD